MLWRTSGGQFRHEHSSRLRRRELYRWPKVPRTGRHRAATGIRPDSARPAADCPRSAQHTWRGEVAEG